MEILIVSYDADPPHQGGVATMTSILAQGFVAMGHTCSLGYLQPTPWPSAYFKDKIWLSEKNMPAIREYAGRHTFGLIVCQFVLSGFEVLRPLRGTSTKLLVVHHSRPCVHGLQKDTLYRLLRESTASGRRFYTRAKILAFPILHWLSLRKERNAFVESYKQCDRFVLLSERFFPQFLNVVPHAVKEKMAFIGNPATFDVVLPESCIQTKQKQVVVVTRFTREKNVAEMLRVWKQIEADPLLSDWSLTMLGDGDEIEAVKEKASVLGLERVVFAGFADPVPYYRVASITMMTSLYEGWPLTLLESQQMGVVPIVYDSFESLPDIVTDSETGIIVPNGDLKAFVTALKQLMQDKPRLQMMMKRCLDVSLCRSKSSCVHSYLAEAGYR